MKVLASHLWSLLPLWSPWARPGKMARLRRHWGGAGSPGSADARSRHLLCCLTDFRCFCCGSFGEGSIVSRCRVVASSRCRPSFGCPSVLGSKRVSEAVILALASRALWRLCDDGDVAVAGGSLLSRSGGDFRKVGKCSWGRARRLSLFWYRLETHVRKGSSESS